MRALFTLVCLFAFAAPAAAQTAPPPSAQPPTSRRAPTRQQVRALLSGVEDVPTDDDWRALGDGALPALIALYDDTREPPYVRLRAMSATAAFARPATHTFLLAVARDTTASNLFVRAAVLALGRGFGRGAVRELATFLDHAEPVVRAGAATSLGRVGGAHASAALRARRAREPDATVRAAIDRALR